MVANATAGDEGTTFVLGGARSGKSRYAESLITARPQPWVYIATAEAHDDEMAARIAEHKARREAGWQTIEAPHELPEALNAAPRGAALSASGNSWGASMVCQPASRRALCSAMRAAISSSCASAVAI